MQFSKLTSIHPSFNDYQNNKLLGKIKAIFWFDFNTIGCLNLFCLLALLFWLLSEEKVDDLSRQMIIQNKWSKSGQAESNHTISLHILLTARYPSPSFSHISVLGLYIRICSQHLLLLPFQTPHCLMKAFGNPIVMQKYFRYFIFLFHLVWLNVRLMSENVICLNKQ